MTSKQKKKSAFIYESMHDIPVLPLVKVEWDLAKLYYTNTARRSIESDLQATEAAYLTFAKKWRTKPFATNPKLLLKALLEYEKLSANPTFTRPGRYYSLRTCLNSKDHEAEAQLALINRRLRKVGDQLLFFTLTLGGLSERLKETLLKEPVLKHYHYHLQRLFRSSAHHLSEAEEKIINLKGSQSYSMWVDMTDKIISNRTVTYKGKILHIPEAIEHIQVLPFGKRQALWDLILKELEQISEVAEHEFNAIGTDAHTEGELRKYPKPYSATALAYEDSETSLEALVAAVTKSGFSISKKFYQIKAGLHGVASLPYAERNADFSISQPRMDFETATAICRDVFYGLKSEYGQIFDSMLSRGQIDVYPKAGKQGGAFMSDQTGHPIMVMLNHTPTFNSLETLAHEMGHAIHAHRSATQSSFYDGHSTITAETASTLFENLVFDAVYAQANKAMRVSLLHDRLMRDVSTIQRQIAFFNLELAIHQHIIKYGAITKEILRDLTVTHLKSYLGKAVDVREKDGYSFVYVSHLRYGFYVYTYSYGLLMSSIMSERYKADNNYIENIDKFLCAGASASVADIFKSIGIDTTNPDTFTTALKAQKQNLIVFEKLLK